MTQRKQANILTPGQIVQTWEAIAKMRHALKYNVMFHLSVRGGLRAMEIAGIEWGMVTDAEGQLMDHLSLHDRICKKGRGRKVPMHKALHKALYDLQCVSECEPSYKIIKSERGGNMSAATVVNWFERLYKGLGFTGCSSHSGRRTAITAWATLIPQAGGSLIDVMQMAGHNRLNTTQRYIQGNNEAKQKLISLIE